MARGQECGETKVFVLLYNQNKHKYQMSYKQYEC